MGRTAKQTLSQKVVDSIKPNGRQQTYGDAATKGLRLWVGVSGQKRWQILRPGGSRTILDTATTTLEQARLVATSPEPPPPAKLSTTATIGQLIDLYAEARGQAWVNRTRRIKHLTLFLRPILDRPITAMTKPWIEERQEQMLTMTHRLGSYRASSVATYRKTCATFTSWAVEEELLTKTPFRKLRRLPINDRVKALSEDQIKRLKKRCWKWERTPIAACVMLAVCTGMRRNECLRLEWADIDLKEERIHLPAEITKSRKTRSFHIPTELAFFLEESRASLPATRPFACGLYYEWDMLRCSLGFAAFSFHSLRHSWATSALRRGGNLKAIQQQLGHHSIEVTSRYLHALGEDSKALARLMDEPWPIRPPKYDNAAMLDIEP